MWGHDPQLRALAECLSVDIVVVDKAARQLTVAFYACGTRVIKRPGAWAADVLPRLQQQQQPGWRPQAGVPG